MLIWSALEIVMEGFEIKTEALRLIESRIDLSKALSEVYTSYYCVRVGI